MNQPFTHLICDCDGVLIDSETVTLEVLVSELRLWAPDTAWLTEWVRGRLGTSLEALLLEFFEAVGVAGVPPGRLIAIRETVEQECDRRASSIPRVASALASIDLPKAVASNSSRARVAAALKRTGLAPLFGGRVYTADAVGRPKPKPDVYLAAAHGFGVPPTACLAVDDSVTGVSAAAAAGMYVVGFAGGNHVTADHMERLACAGARMLFTDMVQLPTLIQNLCRPQQNQT